VTLLVFPYHLRAWRRVKQLPASFLRDLLETISGKPPQLFKEIQLIEDNPKISSSEMLSAKVILRYCATFEATHCAVLGLRIRVRIDFAIEIHI
jgi:hypothetical protein